jgi:aryl-alcohol dehydrogenase-like predicted oxidoreductase
MSRLINNQYFGVGSIPWSPLARGLLTRPFSEKTLRGNTDWAIGRFANGLGTEAIVNRYETLRETLFKYG